MTGGFIMWMAALRLFVRRIASRSLRVPDERGQGMLEYAVIGGIVIVGAIATLAALSGALNQIFAKIANTLSQY
jgi:Flp pilus assembly pilin Flp